MNMNRVLNSLLDRRPRVFWVYVLGIMRWAVKSVDARCMKSKLLPPVSRSVNCDSMVSNAVIAF